MASAVWYIRHGESESNVKGVFAGGQDNTPLTKLGKEQAKRAGKELKHTKVDHIICSPLDRARNTAEIIASEIDFDTSKIIVDDRFQEYDVGVGNGTPYDGATSEQLISFAGAEDTALFARRVRAALLDVKKMSGTVLIIAHGGVGKLIHCLEAKGDPKEFYDYHRYPNAKAAKLNLDWLT